MAQLHNFLFTSYDESSPQNHENISYMVFQREKCPKTGKLHWQGYIELHKKRRFTSLKKLYPTWHMEAKKGSQKQAIAYCTKTETRVSEPVIIGEPKKQGKRNDIALAKQFVQEGKSVRDFIDECNKPNYQNIRTMEKLLVYKEKPRDFKPIVIWLYGPTGSGKTKVAKILSDYLGDTWWSAKDLRWWHNYDAHEVTIFDDFRKDFCTFHELLRILDRYPYSIENKGGFRQLLAKYMIITSPYSALHTYITREDVNQLIRRIDLTLGF